MFNLTKNHLVRAIVRNTSTVLALAAFSAPAIVHADTIDYSNGFNNLNGFTVNQAATPGLTWNPLNNNALVLTTRQSGPNGVSPYEREAAFNTTPVNISKFSTSFDFQITGYAGWMADGITFCIQNQGLKALGGPGGGLGFGPDPTVGSGPSIGKSVAVKFDTYQNWPDPSNNTTGLFTNGAVPIGGYDLTPYHVNLQSGDRFHVDMNYDGTTLKVVLTDTVTLAGVWQTYTVDIPGTVGGTTAYVGFTGADGGAVSDARILTWEFQSPALKAALSSISLTPNNLCGGLTSHGVVNLQQAVQTDTVVTLSSANSKATVTATVTVPAGQTSAAFTVNTLPTQQIVTGSLCAMLDTTTLKTTLSVNPVGVGSVGVQADYVPAGQSTVGILTLAAPAAPGALTVLLTSANPAVAHVPASITVAAGQTTVSFPITTGAVTVNTPVLVTAALNGTTRTTTLTVRPLRVNTLTTSAAVVPGGKFFAVTVTLEAPATAGGVTVNLSANGSCVQIPASIVIPAGATSFSFPVTTTIVKANTTVVLTASSPVNNIYTNIVVSP